MKALASARLALAYGAGEADALACIEPGAISVQSVLGVARDLHAAVAGAGPALQPLLDDSAITDVIVNGATGVWVDRGRGMERAEDASRQLRDESQVRALAVQLAAAAGQRLDDSSPIVDGTFDGGLRLHAVLPPLGAEGTLISLRTQRAVSMSLEELQSGGMFTGTLRPILDAMIERRANAIISGATGSGKTTLLAALLSSVPAMERMLVIEESAELRPRHPHIVHLQVRRANIQGAGEVQMSDLVRAAMRMRPDRLILGECRGAEVRDVLSALNTGHEGGWATIHANSALDVPARLVALGALAGMGESVVAAQAASALDVALHVERAGGRRRIASLAVFERKGSELVAVPALICGDAGLEEGPGWARLGARLGMSEVPR